MRFNIVLALAVLAIALAFSSAYAKGVSSSKYKWDLNPHVQREIEKGHKKIAQVQFNSALNKGRTFVPPIMTFPTRPTTRRTTHRTTTKPKPHSSKKTRKPTTTTTTKKPVRSTTRRKTTVDPTANPSYPTSRLGLDRQGKPPISIPVSRRTTTKRRPPTKPTRSTVTKPKPTGTRKPTTKTTKKPRRTTTTRRMKTTRNPTGSTPSFPPKTHRRTWFLW